MVISWKNEGSFRLLIGTDEWTVYVARDVLERRAGKRLDDSGLDRIANEMARDLSDAIFAKVMQHTGSRDWIRIDLGDPHVPV